MDTLEGEEVIEGDPSPAAREGKAVAQEASDGCPARRPQERDPLKKGTVKRAPLKSAPPAKPPLRKVPLRRGRSSRVPPKKRTPPRAQLSEESDDILQV